MLISKALKHLGTLVIHLQIGFQDQKEQEKTHKAPMHLCYAEWLERNQSTKGHFKERMVGGETICS